MQAAKLDTFFEIDLSDAGRLQRPVPFVRGFEIVFVNGQKFGSVQFLCHIVPMNGSNRRVFELPRQDR